MRGSTRFKMNRQAQPSHDAHAPRTRVRACAWLVSVILAAGLSAGCSKAGSSASATTDDTQLNARLSQLTHELHRTMVGRKLNRDFDEFVALRKLEVPP